MVLFIVAFVSGWFSARISVVDWLLGGSRGPSFHIVNVDDAFDEKVAREAEWKEFTKSCSVWEAYIKDHNGIVPKDCYRPLFDALDHAEQIEKLRKYTFAQYIPFRINVDLPSNAKWLVLYRTYETAHIVERWNYYADGTSDVVTVVPTARQSPASRGTVSDAPAPCPRQSLRDR
jgi:hypothetical protein